MVPLPMSSNDIARAENPNILLGKSPERDREIDDICQMIRNTGRAGIPSLKYNLTLLGVVRTEPQQAGAARDTARSCMTRPSRSRRSPKPAPSAPTLTGSASRTSSSVSSRSPRNTRSGWRATRRIRACRGQGFAGRRDRARSVDGLKRFCRHRRSPYHGLNFCQGTVAEMLEKPGEEIYDVIRYFGSRKKIFNVHFRNIRGGFLKFQETFIDDGDVDMLKAMRVYKEVGYDGMMMPDHVPTIEGDAKGAQSFAFAFGYIKALSVPLARKCRAGSRTGTEVGRAQVVLISTAPHQPAPWL